jgi:hypothetical protein
MNKLTTAILTLGVLSFNAQNNSKITGVVNMKEKTDAKNASLLIKITHHKKSRITNLL